MEIALARSTKMDYAMFVEGLTNSMTCKIRFDWTVKSGAISKEKDNNFEQIGRIDSRGKSGYLKLMQNRQSEEV